MDFDCVFCRIIKGEIPCFRVYEDEFFLAILDIEPANPGHVVVISKVHAAGIAELPDELCQNLGPVIKRLVPAVVEITGAAGVNVLQNNGADAGQSVFHFHTHIVPRHKGDNVISWAGGGATPDRAQMTDMAKAIAEAVCHGT